MLASDPPPGLVGAPSCPSESRQEDWLPTGWGRWDVALAGASDYGLASFCGQDSSSGSRGLWGTWALDPQMVPGGSHTLGPGVPLIPGISSSTSLRGAHGRLLPTLSPAPQKETL